MEKVIAVVVTYNRVTLLRECIDALRKQTRKLDCILVVNNGSTDGTESWLKEQSDITFISQENIGGAGGFATGIESAYSQGYSWVWCMDDDGYPDSRALEELLNNEPHQRSLLNCAVINKEDRKQFVWKTKNYKTIDEVKEKLIEGVAHPFNGTLIHRSIIERVGLPKKDLFLWGDETEYYYRIVKQNQFPFYTVSTSLHYHPAAAFSLKNDWDFKSAWKMYFYVRNRFHVHRAKFNGKILGFFNYFTFLVAFTGMIMIYQKTDRLKKLSFLAWPIKDAINHNFSATPSFILYQLNLRKSKPANFVWTKSFRNAWNAVQGGLFPSRAKAANV